jgi:hypothetical protein
MCTSSTRHKAAALPDHAPAIDGGRTEAGIYRTIETKIYEGRIDSVIVRALSNVGNYDFNESTDSYNDRNVIAVTVP